jgi:predicted aspartyl protease
VRRALDRGFDPPAPVVPVLVAAPGEIDRALVQGKLDTGADLCAVPDRLVGELDLAPVRLVRAAGFGGALSEAPVYRVDLEVDGMRFPRVEALTTRRPYVIVGRNVLRHLILRVDGPRERLELRRPTAPKR